jgi:hypothetical protein
MGETGNRRNGEWGDVQSGKRREGESARNCEMAGAQAEDVSGETVNGGWGSRRRVGGKAVGRAEYQARPRRRNSARVGDGG